MQATPLTWDDLPALCKEVVAAKCTSAEQLRVLSQLDRSGRRAACTRLIYCGEPLEATCPEDILHARTDRDPAPLVHLRSLVLHDCGLEDMPPLPHLTLLRLHDSPDMHDVGHVAQALRDLQVSECECLESLPEMPELTRLDLVDSRVAAVPLAPELRELRICGESAVDCVPPLQELSRLQIAAATSVDIAHLQGLKYLSLVEGQSSPLPSLAHATSLRLVLYDGITPLPAAQLLVELRLRKCRRLDGLPPLPSLEVLELRGMPLVNELVALPRLRELTVEDCGIASLPPLLQVTKLELGSLAGFDGVLDAPELLQLVVWSCPVITSLANISKCTQLMLRDDHGLDAIHAPEVRELVLDMCPAVPQLPVLQHLRRLKLDRCPGITTLPIYTELIDLALGAEGLTEPLLLPVVTKLELRDGFLGSIASASMLRELSVEGDCLKELPNLQLVEKLILRDAKSIAQIPAAPQLRHLELVESVESGVVELPPLLHVTHLHLLGAKAPLELGDLPHLLEFFLMESPGVTTLPALPHATRLVLHGQQWSTLPEAPALRRLDLTDTSITQLPTSLIHLSKLTLEGMPAVWNTAPLPELRVLLISGPLAPVTVCGMAHLEYCDVYADAYCFEDDDSSSMSTSPQPTSSASFSGLPALRRLEVTGFHTCTIGDLPRLKHARFADIRDMHVGALPHTVCDTTSLLEDAGLESLVLNDPEAEVALEDFHSLRRLEVAVCSQIESLPEEPQFESLVVRVCAGLREEDGDGQGVCCGCVHDVAHEEWAQVPDAV